MNSNFTPDPPKNRRLKTIGAVLVLLYILAGIVASIYATYEFVETAIDTHVSRNHLFVNHYVSRRA